MQFIEGQVTDIRLDSSGTLAARITSPAQPGPGQYMLAWAAADPDSPLATPLFPSKIDLTGFLAAPPVPPGWLPGAVLRLRGPLGRGFHLPLSVRRLALAAFDQTAARLLPLIDLALERGIAVALFTSGPLPNLPSEIEIYPESSLPDSLPWADFLALDLPIEALPHARQLLLAGEPGLACPAEALIALPMPCGGLAACGACAVKTRRGYRLACDDGPVFPFHELIE